MLSVSLDIGTCEGEIVEYSLWYGSIYDLPLQLIIDLYEYEHAF